MDWQLITILAMFLFALLYLATLYHLAHGNERKAMEMGARVVLEALTRDGRIMPAEQAGTPAEAVHVGEEDFAPEAEAPELPEIIVARNERAARQIGDRIMADILATEGRNADPKV